MRLKTFGGLWIEGAPAARQLGARPLALLALAGAAGKKGISRDRAIGILWSEASEEQARHNLSQTLYSLRKEVGQDLIVGTTHLRLDPALGSDVAEFRTATQAGDLETAAVLYTGPFLDGFYLPSEPEFERWVATERQEIHREVVRALERLARFADDSAKPAEAVRWWQRLSILDPLSARYTAGYMRALAAAGDRAGALTRARFYREAVHRELNAEPDPAVHQLEQALQTAAAVEAPPTPVPARTRAPHPRRLRWPLAAALLGSIALVLAVRSVGRAAAIPFLAVGEIRLADPGDTTRVGAILRDMLATGLGSIDGLQVVANSRLVELLPPGPNLGPGALNDAARRAGATQVIEGELVAEPEGFSLSLRRVALDRGTVRNGYIVHAATRSALVDSATAAIARDLKLPPPSVTVTQSRTTSSVAYAFYDEGIRAYYGYDAPAAYRLMKAAFARDSSFAMAAFYVWHLSKYLGDAEVQARMLPHVERLSRKTIERERLLIQLSVALEGEQPTAVAAALADTLTVKYPQDPDGQILLGEVRASEGDWGGSVAAYERAVALDSAAGTLTGSYCRVCRALAFKSGAYSWWDSLSAAERTARRLIALRPGEPGPWDNLVEVLLRLGRRESAESALARSKTAPLEPFDLQRLHRDLIRWGHFEQVDRELIADLANSNESIREDAWWLLMLSLRDQGRLREADTLIHRWRVANTTISVRGKKEPAGDFALLGVDMGRPQVSIRAHRANLATMASWKPAAYRARNLAWQLALVGTAHAAAGDSAVVRRLADSLEALGPASSYGGRDTRLHHMLRGLLLQRQGRHAEAVDAFRRSLYSPGDGYTRTNLMLARSLLPLGRGAEAISVLRAAIHGGVDGSNTYVSRTELHEALAEAFEQTGQRDSAVAHWRAVEAAWRRADPQFSDRYLRARQKAGL